MPLDQTATLPYSDGAFGGGKTMSFLAIVVLSGVTATQEPPKKLEAPFKIFVFAPEASPEEQKYADAAAKTVHDRLKRRKDWLEVVESRDEAEILVEVYSQGIGQGTSQSTISGSGNTGLSATQTSGEIGVRESAFSLVDVANLSVKVAKGHHFFETEVSFLPTESKVIMFGTASPNRRPSSAADDLAKKIEQHCKDHYSELVQKR